MSEARFDCIQVGRILDDWLDGALDSVESSQLEAHLEQCSSCRAESVELRALLRAAGDLPLVQTPVRDLWPAIEERLPAGPSRPKAGFGAAWAGRNWFSRALAAGLAIAALATAYWLGTSQGEAPRVASSPGVAPQATPRIVSAAVREGGPTSSLAVLEAAFEDTRWRLRRELPGTGVSRSPESERVIEQNLALIEQAIDELRRALAKEPENRGLQRLLLASYQKEVDLLTWAYQLPRG